jgi:molybdopterin-guanine dinucleotide biosynthesis protein A
MGSPKAWLPFGPLTMLARVVRTLQDVTHPVVVVGAGEDQDLPPLPSEVVVVHDERQGRGPLEGIAAGMRALGGSADAAFVVSCDAPLVTGRLVSGLADLLGSHDAAVPHVDGRFEPLVGVYRLSVLPRVKEALAADRLAVRELLERIDARRIGAAEVTALDCDASVFAGVNTPEEYARALERAGLPCSPPPPGRKAP